MKFAISRINMLTATAHAWHRLSPRELLTGIKTSFTRDLRVGFFDYAQLTEPANETTFNSLRPRNRGGVALYSLGNTKGSVIFMTLDTGTEVTREKFHILPMPDVVISHLNALAAKDKKTLGTDPAFIYHGLVIPDELPHQDVEDTHFSPLPTETQPSTVDNSFYSTEEHDSPNHGGESAIIEDSYNQEQVEEPTEQQHIGGVPTEQEEIRGDSIHDATNNTTENPIEDKISVTAKAVKPREKFVRESYLMRERKPVRNVLITNDNCNNIQRDHIYNLSIKGVIKTHGNIAVKALFTECSSLLGKSTFHPISKKTLSEAELKAVIRSSCFVKEKTTPEGIVDKVKARVVAGGNQQDKSIYNLDETSSRTVSTTAVFITVAIAANEGRHVITMDVETAYLNAKMIDDKPVYMKIGPLITAILSQLDSNFEKYQDGKGAVIVKLDEALYG